MIAPLWNPSLCFDSTAENKMKLGVNVDHVATVRQARRGLFPRPVEAAHVVHRAGAHGITVHLRLDRRHIQESDIDEIRREIKLPLNIEMSTDSTMRTLAAALRPHTVTLVPEDPSEITTQGGLRVIGNERGVEAFKTLGQSAGFRVGVFIDPDLEQIEALGRLGVNLLEINTARYTEEFGTPSGPERLDEIRRAADRSRELGFTVAAGHGLDLENIAGVVGISAIEELNIGHSIIARSIFVGLERAVTEVLERMVRPDRRPDSVAVA